MREKIKSWLQRYAPAEIIGTASAVIGPIIISTITTQSLIIALVGTWGENFGFYGTMIFKEVGQTRKNYAKQGQIYHYKTFLKDLRNIFIEFGLAESLDSLLIRPATMYASLLIFDNVALGILVGKIAADFIFYIPTILSFELRKKYIKN